MHVNFFEPMLLDQILLFKRHSVRIILHYRFHSHSSYYSVGNRQLLYADYTASGRLLKCIEEYIQREVSIPQCHTVLQIKKKNNFLSS